MRAGALQDPEKTYKVKNSVIRGSKMCEAGVSIEGEESLRIPKRAYGRFFSQSQLIENWRR